jgi:hypothetical protein
MSFDLYLNPRTRDLSTGYMTGTGEVLQRLATRLLREFGEWFLATQEGVPWLSGLLGSKTDTTLNLLVRKTTLQTTGVSRILSMNTLYDSTSRSYSIYMQLLVVTNDTVNFWLTEEGVKWAQA